jgi:2-amino-4-hydroxy-6-hydroxymethyldihydropteridine diphosphokinase
MHAVARTAYFSLGSNLGDRAANLLRAVTALIGGDLRLSMASSIYETDPVGVADQPMFLNMVVAVTAPRLEPFSLLNFCLATETRLGRRPHLKHPVLGETMAHLLGAVRDPAAVRIYRA